MPWPYMPYGQTMQPAFQQPAIPQTQVVRVNGRGGADAYAIGPNSSAMLLDESGTLVWLVTTDGAGYKTVSPYDITPHEQTPAPDWNDIDRRIRKLEDAVNGHSADFAAAGTEPGKSGRRTD